MNITTLIQSGDMVRRFNLGGSEPSGILFVPIMCCATILFFVLMLFWIAMIVDVIRHDFPDPVQKIVWFFVVFFLGWIGGVIYYIMVKRTDPMRGSW